MTAPATEPPAGWPRNLVDRIIAALDDMPSIMGVHPGIRRTAAVETVLDALAAEGRIIPGAGDTVVEWGVKYPSFPDVYRLVNEHAARENADAVYNAGPAALMSRTVTTWTLPDGATLVQTTPWAVTE